LRLAFLLTDFLAGRSLIGALLLQALAVIAYCNLTIGFGAAVLDMLFQFHIKAHVLLTS
jgi:hypothetical protein